MNGVHDMGGMQCFGKVVPEENEPVFHEDWEASVFAMVIAMRGGRTWNIDESRFCRESIDPGYYLSSDYYRIWLAGLKQQLIDHELITADEMDSGVSTAAPNKLKSILTAEQVTPLLTTGGSSERTPAKAPRFAVGESVVVRNLHPLGHTRVPGYTKGKAGTIARIHGCHVFPDSSAAGLGDDPHWLYNIRFESNVLWGDSARHGVVHVDMWEPYLES